MSPPGPRRWLTVLWPAFVLAGAAEMFVFAHVDPGSLHDIHGAPVELSPIAVYSIAFFAFWAMMAVSAAITQGLDRAAAEVNEAGGAA